MRIFLCAALLFACSIHGAHAQSPCPWMNEATAGGALGGEAVLQAELLPQLRALPFGTRPDAECRFTVATGPSTLVIRVQTPNDRDQSFAAASSSVCDHASSPRRLIGVGNEAIACTRTDNATVTEIAVGRVRNRLFQLQWTHPPLASTHWQGSTETPESIVQTLAEQVSGAMF